MLTTGLEQPHGSIARGSREIESSDHSLQGKGADSIVAGAPTDCPVCGDVEAEPIAVCSDFQDSPTTSNAFLALRCTECGTVYISPAAVPTDSPRSTDSSGDEELSEAAGRIVHRSGGVDAARILVLHRDSSLDEKQLGSESFPLIVLDGTLEYSQSPSGLLAALREALEPGAQIVLILKNLASPGFALFGGRHSAVYDVPRQRALYSLEGIRRLAGRAALEVRSVSTVSDAGCWVESCRRALVDWRAPAWLARRFAKTSVVSRTAFRVLEAILQRGGRGGIVVVSLTKPR